MRKMSKTWDQLDPKSKDIELHNIRSEFSYFLEHGIEFSDLDEEGKNTCIRHIMEAITK